MITRWLEAALLLFALGATLGTALDAIHVHTGTTRYRDPWLLEMAWWVPLLFGSAGIAVGLPRPALERLLRRGATPSVAAVAASTALFVLAYALSGTLPGGNLAKTVALGALFSTSWAIFDRSALGLGLAFTTALGGSLFEVWLTGEGAFEHLQPDAARIPYWLPCLYACAQVAIGGLGVRLTAPPTG